MEIRHLEFFLEVARQKNFGKAAQRLHISQPSVSKAVKELEIELGTKLFHRSNKFVQLTDTGEAILEQAHHITASFKNIKSCIDGLEHMQAGTIHIGLPPITAVTSLSTVLGDYQARYPNIQIHLSEHGPRRIESALLDGLLDFGVFTPEDNVEYECVWFENDPHWLLLNASHPLACKKSVQHRDLDRQPLIIYTPEYKLHNHILDRCLQSGALPEIRLETAQLEMMTQMVAANIGVALLPSKICKKIDNPSLASRPFTDDMVYLRLAMTWKRGRYLSYAAQRFLEFFTDSLNVQPD
ncbi:MAG: LysR family transcriptional regulator [Desulfovibrionaceae bacterium]